MEDIKYPTSKNNRQCIGPCYEPNKFIVHPITLNLVSGEPDKAFCPTNVYEGVDEMGNKYRSYVDQCFKSTSDTNINTQIDILNPTVTFNSQIFLNYYYNINTYDELLEWLNKNSHLLLSTKMRIIECGFSTFIKDIYLIDDNIIKLYTELFSENLEYFYNNTYEYIDCGKNIVFKKNNNKKEKMKAERMKYLERKLITHDEVGKFINKYFEKAIEELKEKNISLDYVFQKKNIISSFNKYLVNKIEKSI